MATPMVNLDVPTVFPYVGEKLVEPVQPALTDEEFNAFLLSVSPNTTEFNFSNESSYFDANSTIDDIIEFTNQNLSNTTTNVQSYMTPRDFIVDCGLDPAEFESLQTPTPSGDADTWNLILHEMLDKMTEWSKTTELSLKQIGISVDDLQRFELLDDLQFLA